MSEQPTTSIPAKKASFWKRLSAYVIDAILISVLAAVVVNFLGPSDLADEWLPFALYYMYSVLSDYYLQGTLGKLLMHIMVVRVDGEPPSLNNAIHRNLGKIFSAILFFQGFFRILAPHQSQTIHDEFAGCLVVEIDRR